MLAAVTLGVALAEADRGVRDDGHNSGPRVRQYLANCEPPIHVAAPWCAAAVQYCSDVAARALGRANPLDAVRHEALVQSYWDWAAPYQVVAPDAARPGDLVLYTFGGARWDHIGLVVRPVEAGEFWAVEGNTSDRSQRDGDGYRIKQRAVDAGYGVAFLRWTGR